MEQYPLLTHGEKQLSSWLKLLAKCTDGPETKSFHISLTRALSNEEMASLMTYCRYLDSAQYVKTLLPGQSREGHERLALQMARMDSELVLWRKEQDGIYLPNI